MLVVASAAEWHDWLAFHHAISTGGLLRIAKKGGQKTITYAAALEVALAWGWIDGQKLPFDDSSWIQRFTPRTKRSSWSRINCVVGSSRASDAVGRAELLPFRRVDVRRRGDRPGQGRDVHGAHPLGRGESRPHDALMAEQGPPERPVAEEVEILLAVERTSDHASIAALASGEIPSKRPSDRASPK